MYRKSFHIQPTRIHENIQTTIRYAEAYKQLLKDTPSDDLLYKRVEFFDYFARSEYDMAQGAGEIVYSVAREKYAEETGDPNLEWKYAISDDALPIASVLDIVKSTVWSTTVDDSMRHFYNNTWASTYRIPSNFWYFRESEPRTNVESSEVLDWYLHIYMPYIKSLVHTEQRRHLFNQIMFSKLNLVLESIKYQAGIEAKGAKIKLIAVPSRVGFSSAQRMSKLDADGYSEYMSVAPALCIPMSDTQMVVVMTEMEDTRAKEEHDGIVTYAPSCYLKTVYINKAVEQPSDIFMTTNYGFEWDAIDLHTQEIAIQDQVDTAVATLNGTGIKK